MNLLPPQRPYTTVVLAMSADGKIADVNSSHPRFGSAADYAHLERQVAQADAVLFGAATLRAGGTAMRVLDPQLIQARQAQGLPPQPIQIVCSRQGKLDPQLKFFQQPVPRWLCTTPAGAQQWQGQSGFSQVLSDVNAQDQIDWLTIFAKLPTLGIQRLAVLGGGELIASLLALKLIDEVWLTVCPILLGGVTAPTPIGGQGFLEQNAPRLKLLSAETIGEEVFLHYQVHPQEQIPRPTTTH
jgi:5-amino-6-(5-phosphoribosylamino)uracil reductase